jgi:hypothetical protein
MEAKRPHQRLFIMADSCYSGNQILRLKQFEADLPASQRESLNVSFQSAGDANQTVLEDKGFTHGGLRKEGGRETQYWLEKQKGEKRVNWTSRTRRPQHYHSSHLQQKILAGFNIKTHAYKPGPNLKNKTAFDEGEEVYYSGDGDDQVKRAHIHKIYFSALSNLPTDYEICFEDGSTRRVEQSGLEEYKNGKWCERNYSCSTGGRRAAAPSKDAEELAELANLLPQNEEPLPDEATGDLDWNAYRSTQKGTGMTRDQMSEGYQAQKKQPPPQPAAAALPQPPSSTTQHITEVEELVAHGKVKPEVLEKLKRLQESSEAGEGRGGRSWNHYRSANKGTGMTRDQMSEGYQAQRKQQPPQQPPPAAAAAPPQPPSSTAQRIAEVEKLVGHGKIKSEVLEKLKRLQESSEAGEGRGGLSWNEYRTVNKGSGMTRDQMSEGYQAQKQSPVADTNVSEPREGFICPACFADMHTALMLTEHYNDFHSHDQGEGCQTVASTNKPKRGFGRGWSATRKFMATGASSLAVGSALAATSSVKAIGNGVGGAAYGVAEGASRAFGRGDTADVVAEKAPSTATAKLGRGIGLVAGAAVGGIASGIGGIGYGIASGAKAATGRSSKPTSGDEQPSLSWNEYRSAHKGSGMSLKEMSAGYQGQKTSRRSSLGGTVGHVVGSAVGAVAGSVVHGVVGVAYGIGAGSTAVAGKEDESDEFLAKAPSTPGAKAGVALGGLVGVVTTGTVLAARAAAKEISATYEKRCNDGSLDMRYAANQGRSKFDGLVGVVATGTALAARTVTKGIESAQNRCNDGSLDMRYAANRGRSKQEYEEPSYAPGFPGVTTSTGSACKNCSRGKGCRWAGQGRPGHA